MWVHQGKVSENKYKLPQKIDWEIKAKIFIFHKVGITFLTGLVEYGHRRPTSRNTAVILVEICFDWRKELTSTPTKILQSYLSPRIVNIQYYRDQCSVLFKP